MFCEFVKLIQSISPHSINVLKLINYLKNLGFEVSTTYQKDLVTLKYDHEKKNYVKMDCISLKIKCFENEIYLPIYCWEKR